ncbi:hypothetical protein [Faecalibacillus intestinalis]|uniref:hypothetical protein n=1 Tax=Faecalibacillus intestinalis TaxID=1982626 RepID=UPI003520BAD5
MSKKEVKVVKEEIKDEVTEKKKSNVKWRIMCKKSRNKFFTVGEIYPVYEITHRNGKAYFRTINDKRQSIFIDLGSNKFGTFELITK